MTAVRCPTDDFCIATFLKHPYDVHLGQYSELQSGDRLYSQEMTGDNWQIADRNISESGRGNTERAPLLASLFPIRLALKRSGLVVILAVIACSIAVHAAVLLRYPKATLASNILIGVAFIGAVLACLQQLQIGTDETRRLWALLASAFVLSLVGQTESTIDALTTAHHATAFTADFFFLVYGIPVVLAIATPNEDVGLKGFFWFDAIQASIAAVLIYLQIFANLRPFGDAGPISAVALMNLYNAENFILAGMVTLRLLAKPTEERSWFYDSLSIYLWSYAVTALVVGYLELEKDWPEGLQDVAWGLPCLAFVAALVFLPRTQPHQPESDGPHQSVAAVIDSLSPILLTLLIVIMGARIIPEHSFFGFTSIAFAVVLYGLRSSFLQGKYAKSQRELAKSSLALLDAVDRLQEQSIRDGLTGLYNRRHFDQKLFTEWQNSIRSRISFALLLIDVDCFKGLNDHCGHLEGDECLRKVAHELASQLNRAGDLIARYGGDEFSAILPCTDQQGASAIGEGMRRAVSDLMIKNSSATDGEFMTVSIGICTRVANRDSSPEEMLYLADSALYRAKQRGRNLVEVA